MICNHPSVLFVCKEKHGESLVEGVAESLQHPGTLKLTAVFG